MVCQSSFSTVTNILLELGTFHITDRFSTSHFRTWREEPALAGLSPSLDALPRRIPEFIGIMLDWSCAVETLVPSR